MEEENENAVEKCVESVISNKKVMRCYVFFFSSDLQLDMFDQQLGVLKTDHVAELEGEPLEDEAMWCAVGRRATKIKSLPDEGTQRSHGFL